MQEELVQQGINKAAGVIGARLGEAGANKLQRMSRRSWIWVVVIGAAAMAATYVLRERT
jgi:hypothetical protein